MLMYSIKKDSNKFKCLIVLLILNNFFKLREIK